MDDPARELARINERLQVIGLWLTQGRCGTDDECVAAKLLEIKALKARREAILAGLDEDSRQHAVDAEIGRSPA